LPSPILKTNERRHLGQRALGHVSSHHQQLINTITIQIGLLNNTSRKVCIHISHELLPGKDRHPLRPEIISVRRITLTDIDDIERLRLSGRSKTSRLYVAYRGDDLSGLARRA